jgi:hypothetical protein
MKWLLNFLERRGRKRIIMDRENSEPYLERYYLLFNTRRHFPFNLFLHHFVKSDPDDVHDHPWPYATLIVKGGYYEWTPVFNNKNENIGEVCKWHGPGSFRWARAQQYHRVELDPAVDCWTLFMPGIHQREWGFLTKQGWVHFDEYLESRSNDATTARM